MKNEQERWMKYEIFSDYILYGKKEKIDNNKTIS